MYFIEAENGKTKFRRSNSRSSG